MSRELDDAVILGLINQSGGGGGGTYHLPTASTSVKGGIKIDGTDFEMDGDKLTLKREPYVLPTASENVKGGVKIGTGLAMVGDVLTATGGGGGGASTYAELPDKPKINNVTLSGNKSLGDLGLGSLAEKDDATGSYTPEGSVNAAISGTQTATVNSITAVGVLPTVTYEDGGIVFNAGALPTKGENQSVVVGVGSVSATFVGTAKAVTVS